MREEGLRGVIEVGVVVPRYLQAVHLPWSVIDTRQGLIVWLVECLAVCFFLCPSLCLPACLSVRLSRRVDSGLVSHRFDARHAADLETVIGYAQAIGWTQSHKRS